MTMIFSGDGTITGLTAGGLPDATIQQSDLSANVAGNGPAFYAYASSGTTMSANTQTKVNFQTELFDTNSNFDTSTSQFLPTVAGYYFLAATVRYDVSSNIVTHTYITHNRLGTIGTGTFLVTTQGQSASHASTLAYFNGTTDYATVNPYVNLSGSTGTGQGNTYFTGFLVRAA